ncbi:hypothetical protein, partial [Paenibacillus sp. GCM10023250]|uniref:hypothetical protein n=1 Tax=Paenibacillus sp. GCM10023250 TaxID=3252648 RepID=UPI00360CEBB5
PASSSAAGRAGAEPAPLRRCRARHRVPRVLRAELEPAGSVCGWTKRSTISSSSYSAFNLQYWVLKLFAFRPPISCWQILERARIRSNVPGCITAFNDMYARRERLTFKNCMNPFVSPEGKKNLRPDAD